MKIDKVFKGIEKLFFSDLGDKQKKEELKEKLLKKIEQTKKEIKESPADEQSDLKDKLYILKKLLDRV